MKRPTATIQQLVRTFPNRGKPHLVRAIEHERGWIGVLEADCLAEICRQLLVAHERLVRGEQIGRTLEEAANPRLKSCRSVSVLAFLGLLRMANIIP